MKTKLLSTVLTAVLISGCTNTPDFSRRIDDRHDSSSLRMQQMIAKQSESEKPKPLIESVKGAWLGSKAVPIQNTRNLPVALDDFVYTYSDKANLATVSARITLLTSIPVRIQPDVFINTSQLLPANAGAMQQGQQPGQPFIQPNATNAALLAGLSTSGDFDTNIAMPFRGRLGQFLDLITARAGVSWEYRDDAIYFFKLVTRTYTFKTLPGTSDIQATIGKTGMTNAGAQSSGSGSGSGGGSSINTTTATFNGTSQSSSSIKLSAWESMVEQVRTMLSRVGKVAANQSTGSITITDTKDIVEQAGRLIERENAKATRQVMVRIELLSVSTNDANEFGLDWSLVATKMNNLVPDWRLVLNSAASTVSSNAAGFGYSVLQGSATNPNLMNGSQALFKVLREIGKTDLVTRTSRTTSNNQPTALAITDQTGYLAYTTPATSQVGGTGGVPGLNPGMVTTGFILNLVPSILDNDRVMLQYSLDISELKSIDNQGQGDYFIQTPATSGYNSYDRISLRAGETAVVTAYERTNHSYNKRGVTPDAGFGSFSGRTGYQAIILLLTPIIVEGAS